MTDTARRGISHRRRSRFASFPPFSRNGWFTVLREGLLVPLEKIPWLFVSHTLHILGPSHMDSPGTAWLN
jgi:hypothetical protein